MSHPGEAFTPISLPPREGDPWVESKSGSLFFINALLTAPLLVVLFPLLLRAGLRAAGVLTGPFPIIDAFPTIAAYLVPYGAWLLLGPIYLIVRNLRMERILAARLALVFFSLLHLGFIVYAAWWWITGGELPAGRSF